MLYLNYFPSIYKFGLSVCLSVCLYPINVKTAEPIGPKFFVGHKENMFTINLGDGREAPSKARKKGVKHLEFLVNIKLT